MTVNDELKKMWMETTMDCRYGDFSILPHRNHGNYENQSQ